MQEHLLGINALLALIATISLARRLHSSGARVWVTVYSLGIALYGFIVFGGAFTGLIPVPMVSVLMRWLWSAVFIFFVLNIGTDRRVHDKPN